jgi:vacuolar-type H+-ATPase subunit B/Vma2
MSSSLSKYIKVGLTFLKNRYAEIVNVRLGDGSMRKGQVLEIAGKRAVV